jgi:hypothetical protein
MVNDKAVEARWRRTAQTMGYRLESSRRHDSRAFNIGTYRLVELPSGRIILPRTADATGYGASLEEIIQFLNTEPAAPQVPPPRARPAARSGRHRRT